MNERDDRPSGARIAHLTTVHPPYDVRIAVKECATLANAGYDVTLLGPSTGEPRLVPGFRFRSIGVARGRLQRMSFFASRMFRAARSLRADLYHFHDPELIPVGMALRLTGARVVYDVHEDVPRQMAYKEYLGPVLRRLAAGGVGAVEWLAARVLDGIVAATPRIASRFPRRKTVIVQNYPIIGELEIRRRASADGPLLVAYVGRLTPEAGAIAMGRAAAIAANRAPLRFVFAGPASEDVTAAIREAAGPADVALPGWQNREQVGELLSRAHIGLVLFQPVANYVEAYPTKLFEYMMAGIPVVASDFPLWRSIIEPAGCGVLVDPEDPEAIAAAIVSLANDPARDEMGTAGRAVVERDYRWDDQGARLLDLYERLLGPRRVASSASVD